jgi:protein disulfide isomerase
LVGELNDRSADIIFARNNNGLFLVRSKNDKNLDEILKKVAPQYKGKLIFVTSDISSEMGERLAEYFSIDGSHLPQVRICQVNNEDDVKFYVMSDPINVENLSKFIDDFLEGKLSPYLKSEPIPAEQKEAVYYLVSKEFNKVVVENPKYVVVEYYAPWCGHCKEFAPVYEKIAEHYKGNDKILIAKMDATANDVEGVQIDGFPTIKVYPPYAKDSPIDYTLERTFEDVVKFIDRILGGEEVETEAVITQTDTENSSEENAKSEL